MTDRELLELAAKAAGHGVEFDHLSGLVFLNAKIEGLLWNPLHNDGDALRLAVALRMQIDILERSIYALALGGTKVCELDRADLAAATRRAITRAAAEIGKGMP